MVSLVGVGRVPILYPFGPDYQNRVLATRPGSLVGYWPLDEAAGAVAYDYSGAGRNGAHTGVTLGQTGIGDGKTCPLYDGTTDYTDIYSASLAAAFPAARGTLMAWAKVAAVGVWTDATQRQIVRFSSDADNVLTLYKTTTNAEVSLVYKAATTITSCDVSAAVNATLGWFHLVLTWDKAADQLKGYANGVQADVTKTGLGTWAGAPLSTASVIGAGTTVPANCWSGTIAHVALWSDALSAGQIARLAHA